MQELGFVDLQRLVRFLGAFGTEANGPRPQKMIGCKSLDESWSIALAVRRDTMSFEETANFMGCEAHDVAGLVKGKHLAVATVPRRLTRPRVQVSEALRFLNGLQSRARPTSADDGELLALSDLRAFHGRDLQRSWLKLIERIRVRSIPLMLLEDQPTGLHSYGVRWSDVPTYLRPSRQTPPPEIAPTSGARAAELSDALCAAVL
jgi:hypothetical protein